MDTGYPALTDSLNDFNRMKNRLKPALLKPCEETSCSPQTQDQTFNASNTLPDSDHLQDPEAI